jgi:RNA polymerase sigma-70 factor (ECF subfamily)
VHDATNARQLVDHLFRERAGQMVAWLTRVFGPAHLELAEEVVQEALLKALQQWPYSGVPDNPSGWLFRVARNGAVDALRRDRRSFRLKAEATPHRHGPAQAAIDDPISLEGPVEDDELRMVFLCCRPELSREARVALSLKTVGGFSVPEIARAFLVSEATVAQRLVRARRQLRDGHAQFDLPSGPELTNRLDSVLEVIYLLFNEGYVAHVGDDLIRLDLCREGLRLARQVADSLATTAPAAHALAALIAFQAARLPARVDAAGEMVLLEEQDRRLWDSRLVTLAFRHLERSADGTVMTTYHVQAAIAAAHATATNAEATPWRAILRLYDDLLRLNPSPVVALNRSVAVSKVHGPAAALQAIVPLEQDASLRDYYLLHAVKARLLADVGDSAAAAESYRTALARTCTEPERRFLLHRLATTGC